MGNILAKLNANNRTHAVVLAYETGVLGPGDTTTDGGAVADRAARGSHPVGRRPSVSRAK
ncbi:hypothetical protein [Streptomyces sp. NPDC007205]|uniref:hypothetical protein n=1 Tax=Streptomyces sp. NPDC007205 TaxID=3154316 RepID=UPI0033C0158F